MRKGKGITNTLESRFAKLKSVDVDSTQWLSGLWAERFEACRRVTLRNLWQQMQDPHYENFLKAAGSMEGTAHGGFGFSDGDLYKWLETAIAVYNGDHDPDLGKLIDDVISLIAKAQQPDGYIFTRVALDKKAGQTDARPFEAAIEFETYNFGHLMTAACLHYRVTGKRTLLDVAVRLCDFLVGAFAHPTPDLARFDICPSHYMGIVEMYRTTGDPRYLELGRAWIDMRDLVENGTDMNQERLPFRRQRTAVGHAVRANYLYAGAADLYAETGDDGLLAALTAIWDDVATRKLYITGATGALDTGTSPSTHGSFAAHEILAKGDAKVLSRLPPPDPANAVHVVQQAYGREYQLPNLTAYNESCATIGNVMWSWRMLQITGEAKYAEMVETTLINGVLSTIGMSGRGYFYSNPLKTSAGVPFPMRWSTSRQDHISCYCCPPNIARTVAETSFYSYCAAGAELWTCLYGASRWRGTLPNGTSASVLQETAYPWEGDVRFTIESCTGGELALMTRVPSWAAGADITVKRGARTREVMRGLSGGRYYRVCHTWEPGDVVHLRLPMEMRLVEGHHLVEETRGQAAVLRGPVVYCLESQDIQDGAPLSEIVLPREARLRPRDAVMAGCRIVVLEGHALRFGRRTWGGDLYREVSRERPARVGIRMIPYFAWANRSSDEMSVWLPLH